MYLYRVEVIMFGLAVRLCVSVVCFPFFTKRPPRKILTEALYGYCQKQKRWIKLETSGCKLVEFDQFR